MPKQSKIRWSENDLRELRRVVRNYNAKIDRLAKKELEPGQVLPPKISLKTRTDAELKAAAAAGVKQDKIYLKELINTRADLNRELNSLRRFSRKGAETFRPIQGNENNLQITNWQFQEMSRRAGIINRRRAKRKEQLEAIEVSRGGEKLGYTRGEAGAGSITENELKPIKAFTRTMGARDVKQKVFTLFRESTSEYYNQRDERLRENYIKGLEQNLNREDPTTKAIVAKIKNMDIKEFVSTYIAEDPDMEFLYPPDEQEQENARNELVAIWDVVLPDQNEEKAEEEETTEEA